MTEPPTLEERWRAVLAIIERLGSASAGSNPDEREAALRAAAPLATHLQAIIDDPTASDEDRADAQAIIDEWHAGAQIASPEAIAALQRGATDEAAFDDDREKAKQMLKRAAKLLREHGKDIAHFPAPRKTRQN